ncbi:aminotransferase class I/II-fold pyridoxal phosphate-dependent enzyme [Symbiobacterium thermophilum]|uniref:Decarboxylase n=1 Tax=Symbiobacterium thermophilum TaxID=2734 RepID=A0A953IC71_SYMTR|nr:aminotransferase class I/II-fold pyridoxal phosphate-dependent enzyme [Symbiobacterium thermophilum]MBY6276669.1 decarboxylase [Symbiobacterium thermophilum]
MAEEQARTPLFSALREYVARVRAPLHVPGHKMGRAAPSAWREFLGPNALAIDLTEAPGLDDLHAPEGVIAEAQELAARAFGAWRSYFLVGGTTAGLHALILAACHPGEAIAVPRNAHRSVLGALILAGVRPHWVRVAFDPDLGIATGPVLTSLEEALSGAAAAVLVHPTYYGIAGDTAAAIDLIHRAGVPALVDEAHGAHFPFHPALPPSALELGADGVVQSLHKTGGSLTQSSLCHLGHGSRIAPQRLQEMLRLVQSTSPSYLLMASLDLARRELALGGREAWGRALELAHEAKRRIDALPGLRVRPTDDPTKLLIDVRGRSISGFRAAERLWEEAGVAVEASGLTYVLAVLSPGDSREQIDALVAGLERLSSEGDVPALPPEPPWPEVVLPPREAYLARKKAVPLRQARGRIAAELVAPYPPGIPVVAPGERLTADVLDYLRRAADAGWHLQGPADPALRSIQVVEE